MVLLYLWATGSVIVSVSWVESKAQFRRWESACWSPAQLFSDEEGIPAPLHLCNGKYGYRFALALCRVCDFLRKWARWQWHPFPEYLWAWMVAKSLPTLRLWWIRFLSSSFTGKQEFALTLQGRECLSRQKCVVVAFSVFVWCSSWSLNVKPEWIDR